MYNFDAINNQLKWFLFIHSKATCLNGNCASYVRHNTVIRTHNQQKFVINKNVIHDGKSKIKSIHMKSFIYE